MGESKTPVRANSFRNEDIFTFASDKSLSRAAIRREAFKQARVVSLSPNFERQGYSLKKKNTLRREYRRSQHSLRVYSRDTSPGKNKTVAIVRDNSRSIISDGVFGDLSISDSVRSSPCRLQIHLDRKRELREEKSKQRCWLDQGRGDHSLNAGLCPPGALWPVLPFYLYWLKTDGLFHVKDFINRDFLDIKEITIGFIYHILSN